MASAMLGRRRLAAARVLRVYNANDGEQERGAREEACMACAYGTMEDLDFDSILEDWLTPDLRHSIMQLLSCEDRLARGIDDPLWDCYFCELQTDINIAEVEGYIPKHRADELRDKYLWKRA